MKTQSLLGLVAMLAMVMVFGSGCSFSHNRIKEYAPAIPMGGTCTTVTGMPMQDQSHVANPQGISQASPMMQQQQVPCPTSAMPMSVMTYSDESTSWSVGTPFVFIGGPRQSRHQNYGVAPVAPIANYGYYPPPAPSGGGYGYGTYSPGCPNGGVGVRGGFGYR